MARYLTARDRDTERRAQIEILEKIEARFQPAIARELARAMRIMARGFADTGDVPPLPNDHQERIGAIVDRMVQVSLRVMAGRVLNSATPPQKAAIGPDGRIWSPYGRRPIEAKDFASTVAKLALRYITLEAYRQRIVRITETTRQTIITQVARGFDAGLGQEGVARLIRQAVPEIARARSGVIARTETHGAAGYGAQGAAVETGLELRKEWVASFDERTRESHAAANGQTIGLQDYFDIGGHSAQYPGDPALPPEECINCRCVSAYVVDD
jgi:hypothetical protein